MQGRSQVVLLVHGQNEFLEDPIVSNIAIIEIAVGAGTCDLVGVDRDQALVFGFASPVVDLR